MTIVAIEDGDRWILAKDFRRRVAKPFDGNRTHSSPDRAIPHKFWTGDGWESTKSFAKSFATEDEANIHLAENRHRMESA